MTYLLYIIIGLLGGLVSGSFGIGGGTIMVPLMVYLLGLTQHQAQGTALATILPPVGILAVMKYYYSGNVKVNIAIFLAMGFVFGALLGANFIHTMPDATLKRTFGIFLMIIGMKMAFLK